MIVVLAGAGASRAVSAKKYPTTVEFFERLPANIRSDPLFTVLSQFVAKQKGKSSGARNSSVDIEDVLFSAWDLSAATRPFYTGGHVANAVVNDARISQWAGNTQSVISPLSNIGQRVEGLRRQIEVLLHDVYSELPEQSELESNWLPFLEILRKTGHRIELFTVNYDAVIEEAVRVSGVNVEAGIDSRAYARLSLPRWDGDTEDEKRPGLITKLHGSLNWTAGANGEIFLGGPVHTGQHARQLAIYPGYKGRPEAEPFVTFHRYFGQCLNRATCFIVIGFAFRDSYLNELFTRELRPGSKRYTVNPVQDSDVNSQHRLEPIPHLFENSLSELERFLL